MDRIGKLIRAFDEFTPDANNLALDFINTVDWRLSDHPEELLTSYDHFLAWSVRVGILDADGARKLSDGAAASGSRHTDTENALARKVRTCREDLVAVLRPLAEDSRPPADALARLNEWLQYAFDQAHLSLDGGTFQLDFESAGGSANQDLLWPLAPAIHAASDLLLNGKLDRLRTCGNPTCGWFFYDTSKNGSRRWCSMSSCGNREKAKKHYHRAKTNDG